MAIKKYNGSHTGAAAKGLALIVLVAAAAGFMGCNTPLNNTAEDFVPATGLEGVPLRGVKDAELDLSGVAVVPANATRKTIVWSVVNAGGTGITTGDLADAKAVPAKTGKLSLRAAVSKGGAEEADFTQDLVIPIVLSADFVAATNIAQVPTASQAGTELDLTGAVVEPANATQRTIVWKVVDPGATGATDADLEDGKAVVSGAGTLQLQAVIADGGVGEDYTQEFSITITAGFVAVTNIAGVPETGTAEEDLDLNAAVVEPAEASRQAIVWSVVDAGGTGVEAVNEGIASPTAAGTLKLQALIGGGTGPDADFTQEFTIVIGAAAPFVAVTNISGIPAAVNTGTDIDLTQAVVEPAEATNKTIEWTLVDGGSTGVSAIINGHVIPYAGGDLKIRATIAKGTSKTEAYTKDFTITVTAPPPPAFGVTFVKTENDSSGTTDESEPGVPGSLTRTWTLRAKESPWVYFAANLSEGQSITEVSGAAAGKVTRGSADGSTASATLEVFKVDTRDLQFEGGPRDFAFTVAEDGQEDKTVTVNLTVDVESGLTGVAVFKVLSDPTPVVAYGSAGPVGDEILERLDAKKIDKDGAPVYDVEDGETQLDIETLFDAIIWVDRNAEANTEYLIRVEKSEAINRIILTCMRQNNVTLRLRGYGEAREISCLNPNAGNSDDETYGNVSMLSTSISTAYNSNAKGFINVGESNGTSAIPDWGTITLQLEKNITLNGFTGNENTYGMIVVNRQHALVMLDGSKITGHKGVSTTYNLLSIRNQSIAGYFSMYSGAEISGNETCEDSGSVFHLVGFASENTGSFYKEKGARVMNNIDASGDTRDFVSFRTSAYNYDISDSVKSYKFVEAKKMVIE